MGIFCGHLYIFGPTTQIFSKILKGFQAKIERCLFLEVILANVKTNNVALLGHQTKFYGADMRP